MIDERTAVSQSPQVYVGFDPGGLGNFGWCVAEATDAQSLCVLESHDENNAKSATDAVLGLTKTKTAKIIAIGIDSPLFWSSEGDRVVDRDVRGAIKRKHCPTLGGTVQNVNSLRGACLAQGILAAHLMREAFPEVQITESHPKALLWLLGLATPDVPVDSIKAKDLHAFVTFPSNGDVSEHQRDAALGAYAAWAMASPCDRWTNLFTREPWPFVPVPPVGYWMPKWTVNRPEERIRDSHPISERCQGAAGRAYG